MNFSRLAKAEGQLSQTAQFGGYWPEDTAREHQFYEMTNLSGDEHPYLAPRGARTRLAKGDKPWGIHGGERLIWADGGRLYYNGMPVGEVSEGEKQFVQMGAYLLILPDKLLLDTVSMTLKAIEAEFSTVGAADVSLCAWDGSDLGSVLCSATAPEEPTDGMLWLDTGSVPHRLCQYTAASLCWFARTDTAIRISAAGIGALFSEGDGVFLSGCKEEQLNGSHVLLGVSRDSIRFEGLLGEAFSQKEPLTVKRVMPDLDYAVELNNRIWGCSSAKREIYACKLGDPYNWNCFAGTAADSYAVTVGTLGDFTGAAAYQGAALFFKEHCVHKVLGSKPANFQVTASPMAGVKAGAHKTLALADGYLFYQGTDGVRVYGSGGATLISGHWGADAAGCGGAFGGKYYLYLPARGVLCYDTANGLWHREDDAEVLQFARCGDVLYAQLADGSIRRMAGAQAEGEVEQSVCFQGVTGAFPLALTGGSYVSDLTLRAQVGAGGALQVDVCYDDSGEFLPVYAICGDAAAGKKTYRLPILPRLAETMRIRLRGQGDVKIFGMSKRVRKL